MRDASNKLLPLREEHSLQMRAPLPGTISTPVPKQTTHTDGSEVSSALLTGWIDFLVELSADIRDGWKRKRSRTAHIFLSVGL